MKKQRYYEATVAAYLKGIEDVAIGACPGCEECGLPEEAEQFFTWLPCEICKTSLGGNREAWHCVIDGKIVHGVCCEECAYYLNYG